MRYLLRLAMACLVFMSCGGTQPAGGNDAASENMSSNISSSVSPADIVDDDLNITLTPPEVSTMNKTVAGFTRGINLGNGLDAPSIGEWGVVLEENHFKYAKAAGLDHVRLPVRFSAHAQDDAPYTIDEKFFEMVDWALEMAAKYGLNIIVDMHHYEEIMKNPNAHLERFKGMWKQIAERYKDQPKSVAFELLNEPCEELKPEILHPLMKETFQMVRETNPTRLIIINPYFWSNTEWLDRTDVSYADKNTVVTFHEYQPILFTHQGAPWMPPEFHTKGIVFPGPGKIKVKIEGAAATTDWVFGFLNGYNNLPTLENPSGPKTVWEEFDRVTAFIERTGLPVYMGEFAAMDFADARSREIYIKMIRKEAERRGIGWCYWDDGGHNKGIDVKTGKWTPLVKRALFDN